jgi:hypothetical protein
LLLFLTFNTGLMLGWFHQAQEKGTVTVSS